MSILRHKSSTLDADQSRSISTTTPLGTPDGTSANTSSGTLVAPGSLQQHMDEQPFIAAGPLQRHEAKRIQDAASITSKIKWTASQRKEFLHYLDQLHDSNDLLQSIVSMQAMLNIHDVLITPALKGVIPEETRLTERCLRTLHLALVASNTANFEHAPLRIAVRIMEPANYAKTKKQLVREHDYIAWSHNESVYPIQLEDRGGASSRMVLVGSQLSTPRPSSEGVEIHDMPLSSMLCELDPEADESFKDIGYIACPAELAYRHRLYQDISMAWKSQVTLEEIIADVPKFKTFHSLAVQLALSYVYLICFEYRHLLP